MAGWPETRAARQGSQKTALPAGRVHSWQRGLPQCWQKAVRSRSGWLAQVMLYFLLGCGCRRLTIAAAVGGCGLLGAVLIVGWRGGLRLRGLSVHLLGVLQTGPMSLTTRRLS